MPNSKFDTRQSINHAALPVIGTAANTDLDAILAQINAVIVTLAGTQTITGVKTFTSAVTITDGSDLNFTNTGTASPGSIQFVHNTNASTAITFDKLIEGDDNNVNGTGGSTNTYLTWSHGADSFLTTLSIFGTNASGINQDIVDFLGNLNTLFYGPVKSGLTGSPGLITVDTSINNVNAITIEASTSTAQTYGIGMVAGTPSSNFVIYDNNASAIRLEIASSTGQVTIPNLTPTGAVISTSGALSTVAAGTAGNVLTSNGTTFISSPPSVPPSLIKNYIINGNIDFTQRGTSNTFTGTSGAGYAADRWKLIFGGTTSRTGLATEVDNTVPTRAQSGFSSINSLSMATGGGSPYTFAAGDFVEPFVYIIEGFDYQALHANTVSIGFWFQSFSAGTFSLALTNCLNATYTNPSSDVSRSYVTTFTVTAANTWQFITISIPLDTVAFSADYKFTNGPGLAIVIAALSGTTFQCSSGNLNTWQASSAISAATATNYTSGSGINAIISQVSLVLGGVGLGPLLFSRAGATLQAELAMCERYYEKSYDVGIAPGTVISSAGNIYMTQVTASTLDVPWQSSVSFKVPKVVPPTVTLYSTATGATGNVTSQSGGDFSSTAASTINTNGFTPLAGASSLGAAGNYVKFNYTADADF